jgi:hypothetical protein
MQPVCNDIVIVVRARPPFSILNMQEVRAMKINHLRRYGRLNFYLLSSDEPHQSACLSRRRRGMKLDAEDRPHVYRHDAGLYCSMG